MIYEWHVLVVSPSCRFCLVTQRALVRKSVATRQKRLQGRLHVFWAYFISITDSFFYSLYAFEPCRKFFLNFLVLTTAEGLQGHWTHSRVNVSACYCRDICKGKIIPWISSSRVNEQVCSAVVNVLIFHQSKWLVLSYMIANFVI